MNEFTGIKREGHGFYGIWINGQIVGNAHNPKDAAAKFAKEEARAAMNAQRDASTAAWKAKQAQVEYSKSQAQLETLCPNFYSL